MLTPVKQKPMKINYRTLNYTLPGTRSPVLAPNRAALTGMHDTLVRRAPGWQGAPDGQQAKN